MPDRKITIGNHIDLNTIEANRRATHEAAGRVLDLLETKFHASDTAALFGRLMMGTDHKIERDEKGRRRKVPISMADISKYMDEVQMETEEKRRQSVVAIAQEAASYQSDYFKTSRKPATLERSESRLAFVQAVVDRFLAQPLPNAGSEWQKRDPAFTRDEKLLQDFANLVMPSHAGIHTGLDAERKMRRAVVAQRHSSTWMAILKKEGDMFKKYIEEVTQEKADLARQRFDVANRLVRGQEAIYSDKEVSHLTLVADYTQNVATDVARLPFFEYVLTCYLERFPQATSFHAILVPKKEPATQ